MEKNYEQTNMILNYGNEISIISELRKSSTPKISKVKVDEYTDEAQKNFDYDFNGEIKFYPFELNDEIKNLDFNILAIVGASGSGKSTISQYFGTEEQIEWDNNLSILSNFDSPDEAIERLTSVGLSSVPTWCKPRHVLSVGEGFRADLARKIKSNCVIDEYTSTVDRNVALSCSVSISKYIRRNNIKRCVFVSCHKDFIDSLKPDYVIDLDDACVYDTRGLLRRKFELHIYETKSKAEIWKIFKQHHYLSADLNVAARTFVAFLNDEPVGFIAMLPFPSGVIQNAYRVHRLVVLPDYQGIGIGLRLMNHIANLFVKQGKKIYIRTTHYKLYKSLVRTTNWVETSSSQKNIGKQKMWKTLSDRPAYSFKFVGEYDQSLDENDVMLFNDTDLFKFDIEDDDDYQTNIFDYLGD